MKYTRPSFGDPNIKTFYKSSPFRAGGFNVPIVSDHPISIKENFRRAAECKIPCWVPNSATDFNFAMLFQISGMPDADWTAKERYYYKDWFGAEWMFVPEAGGPMLKPNTQLLDDITEWETKIKFPNLDDYDFEGCCKKWLAACDPEKVMHINIGQGCTERLVALRGGYTDAMCDMALEPEAVRDFLDAFADFEIQVIDKVCKYIPVDYMTYHDDWGTERDTFFSEAMMESMVFEPTKKIFDHIHSKGITVQLHSCGKIERFLPYMVDMGVNTLQIQARANDFKAYKEKYGNKLALEVMIAPDPAWDKEQITNHIHEVVDTYGKGDGLVSNFMHSDPEMLWDGTMELYYYSREKYEEASV